MLYPGCHAWRLRSRKQAQFAVFYKGESEMTHQYMNNAAISKAFYQLLEPITFAGRLDCILSRSFRGFKPICSSRDYLRLDRERLGEQFLSFAGST